MNAALAEAAVVVRRIIAAPAEDLFDAWLEPAALAIWMRPNAIRYTTATLDPRVGGRYEIIMKTDTETFPHTGEYRVIDRPRRLVFTWHSRGTEQKETLVTVDFLARAGGTEVVVTHERLAESARPAHDSGWSSALEHLQDACRNQRLGAAS